MDTLQFLKELKLQKIDISLKDDNLELSFDGELSGAIVAQIRERKNEILDFLKKLESDASAVKSIPRVDKQEKYVLSSTQKRLWILSKFEEANVAYNMQGAYEFHGDLNVEALEQSFSVLIERHEILRTAFRVDEKGEPWQWVLSTEELNFGIEKIDLSASDSPEEIVKSQVRKAALEWFDLAHAPLLKVRLYKLENDHHTLTYTLHHIVSDGWSMKLMIHELMVLYGSFSENLPNPLPKLELQYKDYAHWQMNQLSGDNLKIHRDYWKNRFDGVLPVLEITGDYQRPPVKTYNGGTVYTILDSHSLKAVKDLCNRETATLFMYLLSVVKVLLYRYSGQTDMIIGTPVAGRDHSDLAQQLGLYLNTLAIRSQFSEENSFREVFQTVKTVTLEAFDHQVFPFDEVLDLIKPSVDLSRSPLFDVMIALQNTDLTLKNAKNEKQVGHEEAALQIDRVNLVEAKASKFDLYFDFVEFGDQLGITLEYNVDIFSKETASRILTCLETLIRTTTENETECISKIEILNTEEQEKLICTFNNSESAYPEEITVLDLFRENADKSPDKIALQVGDEKWSFKALEERSNAFAHFLQSKAVKKSQFVGLNLDRSVDMVVAILGVLMTGAAYIPIDPEYPESRVKYMLEDSECKLTVDADLMSEFSRTVNTYSVEKPAVEVSQNDLMYMIYTSGSTGNPKGVLLNHKPVMNLLYSVLERTPVDEDSVLLSLTTISFDIFVTEIYLPLVAGMKLVLGDAEAQKSVSETKRIVLENDVTFLQMTPTRLSLTLDEDVEGLFAKIKNIIVIGEVFSDELFRKLSEVYSGRIINAYGPTETCVYSTMKELKKGEKVTIGTPLNNTQIFILDTHNRLQPIGVPGEICIAGDGLANGYWNNSNATEEKFIDHPFKAGTKLYKTGDIAKWLSNGDMQFIGRKDGQIKLRGYRIELDEIQNRLIHQENVLSAAVQVWNSGSENASLVAYFTADKTVSPQVLRSYLSEFLPAYMIPSHFIQLDALPLTPNGKIDKKRLPNPDGIAFENTVEYIAPENEIQERLAAIWKEILGVDEVGILDNFFDLGGNSIRLIKLVDRISLEFGQRIGYINAFKFPSIESFSEFLSNNVLGKFEAFDKQVDDAVDVMDETFSILNNLEE